MYSGVNINGIKTNYKWQTEEFLANETAGYMAIKNNTPQHPLAEVFGFTIDDRSEAAERFRTNKLCPFGNKVPSCTKDKANSPLGVCSIYHNSTAVITCPIRFRQNWVVAEDAAKFFFKKGSTWTSLSEVRLTDKNGETAGNIDIVLVSYDERGRILDFGSLEVQAVYISGNIRSPFEFYMDNRDKTADINWHGKPNYPKPDYLSSSRKRLVPQMLYKGGILNTWGKKQAVALQKNFFETLPKMPTVSAEKADIAWMLYDLKKMRQKKQFELTLSEIVYTEFEPALSKFTNPIPGDIANFLDVLQHKLDEKLEGNPPDNRTLSDIILQ